MDSAVTRIERHMSWSPRRSSPARASAPRIQRAGRASSAFAGLCAAIRFQRSSTLGASAGPARRLWCSQRRQGRVGPSSSSAYDAETRVNACGERRSRGKIRVNAPHAEPHSPSFEHVRRLPQPVTWFSDERSFGRDVILSTSRPRSLNRFAETPSLSRLGILLEKLLCGLEEPTLLAPRASPADGAAHRFTDSHPAHNHRLGGFQTTTSLRLE
jgi:hypothetical protein